MRWIVRIIGVLVMLVVIIVGSLLLLPADRIAKIAADQVKAQTGRDLVISGEVKITLWPVLGVSTGPVTLSNAPWSDAGPMFSAQALVVGVNTAGLFGGDVHINKIEAKSPVIRLEQRKDGRANWLLGVPSTPVASVANAVDDSAPRALTLENLNVTNARLIYAAEGQETIELSQIDLSLRWADPAGPATFKAALNPAGELVQMNATIDGFADWITGVAQAVTFDVSGPGGDVSFDGVAGILGELAGHLTLKTPETGQFLNALGLGPLDIPKGLGQNADVKAKVTLTRDGTLALRDVALDLDGNTLSGAADIQLGAVPQVNVQLQGGALDLSALSALSAGSNGGGATSGGSAPEAGWSKASIDARGLAAFNGAVSLDADSIDLGKLKLGKSRLVMQLDRARAVFEIKEILAYEGVITGEFIANNRSGLSVGGNISAQGVELNQLLSDLAGITRLSGKANTKLSFLGVGNSVDVIMKSLSGQGTLNVAKGLISGIDLDRLMRSGDGGGGTTVFDSLSATMTIVNGDLRNDDLLFLLPRVRADGTGRVGLGNRDIDYLFTPTALRSDSENGLAIPVRIRGPWANPKIIPDVSGALDLNFAKERKRLEKQAEAELEKTLQKELGIEPVEGQSTEEAIQDKLEDELRRGFESLFD